MEKSIGGKGQKIIKNLSPNEWKLKGVNFETGTTSFIGVHLEDVDDNQSTLSVHKDGYWEMQVKGRKKPAKGIFSGQGWASLKKVIVEPVLEDE